MLVEPKYSGNIGAVARVMMNFQCAHLYLVHPCPVDDDAYTRAMHATEILDTAQIFPTFQAVCNHLDYCVATSSIASLSDKRHLRNPVTLEGFTREIGKVDGNVGLIFGREDYGLLNEEIASCDIMVKIPTSDTYPSLNLSHAVALVLFSIFSMHESMPRNKRLIGRVEKEKLYDYFTKLLEAIDYPEHKKENTHIMFKRMMGRAIPSTWEYHTLMGVLSKTLERIHRLEEEHH